MYYSKKTLPTGKIAEKIGSISEAGYEHGSPWSIEQFSLDLAQQTSDYLVLSEAGQWIGFISYQLVLDEVEITHVVIHKNFQHLGHGGRLIAQLIQQLIQQDVAQIFLEVRVSNTNARQLYEKNGFKIINCRKNYYTHPKEDGIVMCLNIKEVKQ